MAFGSVFGKYSWEKIKEEIYSHKSSGVEAALVKKTRRTLDDFKALISPAASHYLEEMLVLSRNITQKRFGKTIQMYVPLYLSNECSNVCTYCGFSFNNHIPRKTLSDEEILNEAAVIKSMGYDHVLLVTGEANQTVGVSYLANAISLLRPHFSNISVEVQPLEQYEYELLGSMGIYSVLVYQETYHPESYFRYHLKGRKSNFFYRLQTPDRIGRAGIHKTGLGVLIGLDDWRTDSFFCALHLDYLEKKYWRTKYSVSFPRLRPFEGSRNSGLKIEHSISEKELAQLICAYRIFNEEVELSLSTRERSLFRNHIIQFGITSMSAGSKTNPGGYAAAPHSLEQFEIDDTRSPQEISEMIRAQGYEAVWKDWDRCYHSPAENEFAIKQTSAYQKNAERKRSKKIFTANCSS